MRASSYDLLDWSTSPPLEPSYSSGRSTRGCMSGLPTLLRIFCPFVSRGVKFAFLFLPVWRFAPITVLSYVVDRPRLMAALLLTFVADLLFDSDLASSFVSSSGFSYVSR